VKCLGFSANAFLIIGPFNLVMSSLVHANLNWTFGPFRYVLASPVFHRWHHVKDPAARDKNFAPTFPALDLMFGTFYMPKGVLPADYGVDGVPTNFVGQLAYPFVVYAERLGLTRKPRPGAAAA
jgi:sterol desaturase/sphingolipid hydroxylase (fatty acid hydroxylase superfamily)